MHANLQQLLSLRDGAPVDAVWRDHVAGCRHCQRELEQLECVTRGLRALADQPAPVSAWTEVRARLRREHGPSRTDGWRHALTAPLRGGLGVRQALLEGMLASAIAVLAVVCLRVWTADLQEAERTLAADQSAENARFQTTPANYASTDELLSSRWLQELWVEIADASAELDLDKQRRINDLKNRIAALDYYCLTAQNLTPEVRYSIDLQRSRLMDEMLDVYGAPVVTRAKFELPR